MTFSSLRRGICIALASLALAGSAYAQGDKSIVVASTTSTEQSGLFGYLLPAFKKDSGIEVRVVAVGTGQALDIGRRGDADVVFVHDQAAEEKFVAEGFAVKRLPVMYNDFVLIGPKADPAGLSGNDIKLALAKLGASQQAFISRGDNSGTHAAELRYWKAANIDLATARPAGYKACGCGMGPALNLAAQSNAYVLADRGTWIAFKNRADLAILVQGDQRLFNQYGVMVVNPEKHAHVKKELAQAFVDWVISPRGQQTIAAYQVDGEQLFFPNAKP